MADPGFDVNGIFPALGVTGLGAWATVTWWFVTGRIVRGSQLEDALRLIAEKDAQLTKVKDDLIESVVPALTRSTLSNERVAAMLTVETKVKRAGG